MARFVKPILNATPPDRVARSARPASCCSWQPVPRAARRRPLQPGPADDHERSIFSTSGRDRRAQGDDVGVGHHRHVSGVRRRARPTCCCTITWARSTATGRGARARRRRDLERDRRGGGRGGRRDPPGRRSRASTSGTADVGVGSRTATSCQRTWCCRRRSEPDVPGSWTPTAICRPSSSRRSAAKVRGSSSRPAPTRCRTSPAGPSRPTCAARFRFPPASTTWSAPTIRRSARVLAPA